MLTREGGIKGEEGRESKRRVFCKAEKTQGRWGGGKKEGDTEVEREGG